MNNKNDLRQINGRKPNLIVYVPYGSPTKRVRPGASWAVEALMPSRAKELQWDKGFKGEEGRSQDNRKSRGLAIRCSPCRTVGLSDIKLPLVQAVFLGQALI